MSGLSARLRPIGTISWKRAGHETGGVGYITKPFDPLAMTNTVRTVLERARRGERDALRREWQQAIGRN